MEKFLIFTNSWDPEKCNGFSLFNTLESKGINPNNQPILLNMKGQVEIDKWQDADLIILPDANIFIGDDYNEIRSLLNSLMKNNITLYIVIHKNGNFIEAYSNPDTDGEFKLYLKSQPSIYQSYVRDDFYCRELNVIIESIFNNNDDSDIYNKAIEEAKKIFPDLQLEAKLELLHTCLTPDNKEDINKKYDDLSDSIKNKAKTTYYELLTEMQRNNINCLEGTHIEKLKKLRNSLFDEK